MPPIGKSKFDLTRSMISATNFGVLQPFLLMDVVPNDDIRLSTDITFRFDPLILPSFDNYKCQMDYYYVPYRLLDKNFENILTRIEDPYLSKTISKVKNFSRNTSESLLGAFGVPYSSDSSVYTDLAVYPLYAYWLVVNYYYRDRLLDPSYNPEFDYNDFDTIDNLDDLYLVNNDIDYFQGAYKDAQLASSTVLDLNKDGFTEVSELKMATRLQQLKEKLMLLSRRRGNRYVNYLRDTFGTSPREELLGIPYHIDRVTRNLSVSEVVSTSSTDGRPLAGSAGKIFDNVDGSYSSYTTNEHGIILGLLSIKPYLHYISGVPRIFLKSDFSDFYHPTFVNLGMQELSRKELDINANKDDVFGYTFRYQELRESYNQVAGSMMSEDYWHSAIDLKNEYLSNNFRKINSVRSDSPFGFNLRSYAGTEYKPYTPNNTYYKTFIDNGVLGFVKAKYDKIVNFDNLEEFLNYFSMSYDEVLYKAHTVSTISLSEFHIPIEDTNSSFSSFFYYVRSLINNAYQYGNDISRYVVLPLFLPNAPFVESIELVNILTIRSEGAPIELYLPIAGRRNIIETAALNTSNVQYFPYYAESEVRIHLGMFTHLYESAIVSLEYNSEDYQRFLSPNSNSIESYDGTLARFRYTNKDNQNKMEVSVRYDLDVSHIRFKAITQISALRPLPISYNPVLI